MGSLCVLKYIKPGSVSFGGWNSQLWGCSQSKELTMASFAGFVTYLPQSINHILPAEQYQAEVWAFVHVSNVDRSFRTVSNGHI